MDYLDFGTEHDKESAELLLTGSQPVAVASRLSGRAAPAPISPSYYERIAAEYTDTPDTLHLCYIRANRLLLRAQFHQDKSQALGPHEFRKQLRNIGIAYNILCEPSTRVDYDLRLLGLRQPLSGKALTLPDDARSVQGKAKISLTELILLTRTFGTDTLLGVVEAARTLPEEAFWEFLRNGGAYTVVEMEGLQSGYHLMRHGLISVVQFEQAFQSVRSTGYLLEEILVTAGWMDVDSVRAVEQPVVEDEAPSFRIVEVAVENRPPKKNTDSIRVGGNLPTWAAQMDWSADDSAAEPAEPETPVSVQADGISVEANLPGWAAQMDWSHCDPAESVAAEPAADRQMVEGGDVGDMPEFEPVSAARILDYLGGTEEVLAVTEPSQIDNTASIAPPEERQPALDGTDPEPVVHDGSFDAQPAGSREEAVTDVSESSGLTPFTSVEPSPDPIASAAASFVISSVPAYMSGAFDATPEQPAQTADPITPITAENEPSSLLEVAALITDFISEETGASAAPPDVVEPHAVAQPESPTSIAEASKIEVTAAALGLSSANPDSAMTAPGAEPIAGHLTNVVGPVALCDPFAVGDLSSLVLPSTPDAVEPASGSPPAVDFDQLALFEEITSGSEEHDWAEGSAAPLEERIVQPPNLESPYSEATSKQLMSSRWVAGTEPKAAGSAPAEMEVNLQAEQTEPSVRSGQISELQAFVHSGDASTFVESAHAIGSESVAPPGGLESEQPVINAIQNVVPATGAVEDLQPPASSLAEMLASAGSLTELAQPASTIGAVMPELAPVEGELPLVSSLDVAQPESLLLPDTVVQLDAQVPAGGLNPLPQELVQAESVTAQTNPLAELHNLHSAEEAIAHEPSGIDLAELTVSLNNSVPLSVPEPEAGFDSPAQAGGLNPLPQELVQAESVTAQSNPLAELHDLHSAEEAIAHEPSGIDLAELTVSLNNSVPLSVPEPEAGFDSPAQAGGLNPLPQELVQAEPVATQTNPLPELHNILSVEEAIGHEPSGIDLAELTGSLDESVPLSVPEPEAGFDSPTQTGGLNSLLQELVQNESPSPQADRSAESHNQPLQLSGDMISNTPVSSDPPTAGAASAISSVAQEQTLLDFRSEPAPPTVAAAADNDEAATGLINFSPSASSNKKHAHDMLTAPPKWSDFRLWFGEIEKALPSSGWIVKIGRNRQSVDVAIQEPAVSREHCQLELKDDGVWVRDLGSRHGTFVIRGFQEIRAGNQPVKLEHGDFIRLGKAGAPSLEWLRMIPGQSSPASTSSAQPVQPVSDSPSVSSSLPAPPASPTAHAPQAGAHLSASDTPALQPIAEASLDKNAAGVSNKKTAGVAKKPRHVVPKAVLDEGMMPVISEDEEVGLPESTVASNSEIVASAARALAMSSGLVDDLGQSFIEDIVTAMLGGDSAAMAQILKSEPPFAVPQQDEPLPKHEQEQGLAEAAAALAKSSGLDQESIALIMAAMKSAPAQSKSGVAEPADPFEDQELIATDSAFERDLPASASNINPAGDVGSSSAAVADADWSNSKGASELREYFEFCQQRQSASVQEDSQEASFDSDQQLSAEVGASAAAADNQHQSMPHETASVSEPPAVDTDEVDADEVDADEVDADEVEDETDEPMDSDESEESEEFEEPEQEVEELEELVDEEPEEIVDSPPPPPPQRRLINTADSHPGLSKRLINPVERHPGLIGRQDKRRDLKPSVDLTAPKHPALQAYQDESPPPARRTSEVGKPVKLTKQTAAEKSAKQDKSAKQATDKKQTPAEKVSAAQHPARMQEQAAASAVSAQTSTKPITGKESPSDRDLGTSRWPRPTPDNPYADIDALMAAIDAELESAREIITDEDRKRKRLRQAY